MIADDISGSRTCRNCGETLHGRYCSACGQRSDLARLELRTLASDTIAGMFNIDSTLWRTVVGLTRNPGKVVREYVDGQRKKYFGPARYMISLLALQWLVYAGLGLGKSGMADSQLEGLSEKQLLVVNTMRSFLDAHLDKMIYVVMPIYPLYLKLFFRKQRRTYLEHLVFIMFVSSQVNLLTIPLSPLLLYSQLLHTSITICISLVFFCYAAVVFYGTTVLSGSIRMFFAGMTFILTVMIVTISVLIAVIKYHVLPAANL